MLPAPFLLNTSLFTARQKIGQKIFTMREKKNKKLWRNSCLVFFFLFLFVWISFFWMFFFLSYVGFFFVLFRLISQRTVPNDEQQTNKQKKKIQSYQLALHSLREVLGMEWRVIVRTVGWTQKGGRRRRKKVNKVHEGGESSKSSRRQRMAAQLTVRKHSPHHRAGAVRVSACVVWMLNDNKKNHH